MIKREKKISCFVWFSEKKKIGKVAIWGLSFQKNTNKNKKPLWTVCSHFLLAKIRHKNKHCLGLLSRGFFFPQISQLGPVARIPSIN